jgi:hypothetical protein
MARTTHALIALALVVGCQHDIAALQERTGDSGVPLRGNSGSGSGASADGGTSKDGGGQSGGSGGSDVVHPAADPCQPCTDPSTAAKAVGLSTCCYGLRNEKCGLKFGGAAALCLPLSTPGQANDVCPSGKKNGVSLDGCCRPDGHCGYMATLFGLGCVTRNDIPASVIGSDVMPIACDFTCTTDAQCGVITNHVCAESPADASRRICEHSCQRDDDCPKDQVCALTNDVGMDRVLAFCQAALTDVAPGQPCNSASDCAQGVCLMNKHVCTQLCASASDCPAERPSCATAGIERPSHTGNPVKFSICLP